jgi:hypothetical protein
MEAVPPVDACSKNAPVDDENDGGFPGQVATVAMKVSL